MKTKLMLALTLSLMLATAGRVAARTAESPSASPSPAISDQDISDAYLYLLGRATVLRQLRRDFEEEGFEWNKIQYQDLDEATEVNPNLDVAYSEAWVAVDDENCVLLEIPEITGRYYTWQMLNGWGETILNINDRTFPRQPSGKFALCLKGSNPTLPEGALRVDLPNEISRVVARVELGSDVKEALRLQHEFKLTPMGPIKVDKPVEVPLFADDELPRATAFDDAITIMAGEPDINEGMEGVREKVEPVALLATSSAETRDRVSLVVEKQAIPRLMQKSKQWDTRNGWVHAAPTGNYGGDYVMRTLTNLFDLWANKANEVTGMVNQNLDGSATYTLTFPISELPKTKVNYFWSISALDTINVQVLSNPRKRYLLNKESPLKYNDDGSLTLAFGPKQPKGVAEANWLPTMKGIKYDLTFRFYAPTSDVSTGQYFPPPLKLKK